MSKRLRPLTLALALAGVACADEPTPTTVPTADALVGSYDVAAITSEVDSLAEELEIDRVQRAELKDRVDLLLANPKFLDKLETMHVQAVGVYRWGEGGLMVKLGRGDGRVRFAGSATEYPFILESRSAGAQIGGSASWGVVLVLGLDDPGALEGKYSGAVATVAIADESSGVLQMKDSDHEHELYFVGVAEGMSANAGVEQIRIAFGTRE